jgi:hypothetical protein
VKEADRRVVALGSGGHRAELIETIPVTTLCMNSPSGGSSE